MKTSIWKEIMIFMCSGSLIITIACTRMWIEANLENESDDKIVFEITRELRPIGLPTE